MFNRQTFIGYLLMATLFAVGCQSPKESEKAPNTAKPELSSEILDHNIEPERAPSNQIFRAVNGDSIPTNDCPPVVSETPIDDDFPCQILTTGVFHNDEVDPEWMSKSWSVLHRSDGHSLSPTKITIAPERDVLLDDENEKSGWLVQTVDSTIDALFLFSGFKLNEREAHPCNTRLDRPFFPGDSIIHESGPARSVVYAAGCKGFPDHSPGWVDVWNYRIILKSEGIEQVLFSAESFNDCQPELFYVGDLDGDGRTDIILNSSTHYNTFEPTLYLSSFRRKEELVRCVSKFMSVGC